MDSERILSLIKETEDNIADFIKTFSTEHKNASSFEDWDSKDVVFHINSWMGFAAKKLKDIKSGVEPDTVSDIDSFNITNYNQTVKSNLDAAQKSMAATIQELLNIVSAFTERELLSTSFPTGFPFELWRYIVMDGYIHPNKHLMQYYIESGYYEKFVGLVLKCKNNYLWYAGDDRGVFFFDEFFNNEKERKECFKKFKNSSIGRDDFISEIIQINIL